ncbi:MAG: hypothetical protein PVI00_18875, partial [Desulfobacterales bacterium]
KILFTVAQDLLYGYFKILIDHSKQRGVKSGSLDKADMTIRIYKKRKSYYLNIIKPREAKTCYKN